MNMAGAFWQESDNQRAIETCPLVLSVTPLPQQIRTKDLLGVSLGTPIILTRGQMLNMETIIELAQRFGIKWKSPSTGVALSLLAGASLSVFLLTFQVISTETASWTGVAAAILVFAFWLHTCRIPKNKPNKIGIALALQYETPEERKRIHADLVERISSRLSHQTSAATCLECPRQEANSPFAC